MAQVAVLQPIATQGASLELDEGRTISFFVWTFDATVTEQHSYMADVTQHPVESGLDITDHVQIKPFELTLTGVVTNTPIQPEEAGIDLPNRIQVLYDELRLLFEERSFLTVVTGLERYENMILMSIEVPRQGPGRQAIIPSLKFIQINTVDTAFVSVASIPPRAKKKTKLDKQAKEQADAATSDKADESKQNVLDQTGAESTKDSANVDSASLLKTLIQFSAGGV